MVYDGIVVRSLIALTPKKHKKNRIPRAQDALAQVLTQIASMMMRMGLDAPAAERLLRTAFVQAAARKLQNSPVRRTQSRIASLAGVSRLEVRTILARAGREETARQSRVDSIVAGWRSDPLFTDARGRPRGLVMRGGRASFEHLARKYGRDVTPRALREELLRHRLIKIDGNIVSPVAAAKARSDETIAAESDLKFLASQLAGFDFNQGRRNFAVRRGIVLSGDKKRQSMIKHIALARMQTVLNSLSQMSVPLRDQKKGGSRRSRILLTAVVAADSEETTP